jgi:hypothetical protein
MCISLGAFPEYLVESAGDRLSSLVHALQENVHTTCISRADLPIFGFFIFGSSAEDKVCETTNFNGDVALSLVRPRLEYAQTLTVKGMMT